MTPKRILAAVDRLPQDDAVLARALDIAASHAARLEVVHVLDLPGCDSDIADPASLAGQAAPAARQSIAAALERLGAGGHGAGGTEIAVTVETGSPALRLIALCQAAAPGLPAPDLIVMRAHQRAGIAERILGSTTDRVVAAGCAPVLVVRRPARRPYRGVLLATDGTDDAAEALAFVAALLPGAALRLVQAVHVPPQLQEAMLRVGTDQAAIDAHERALRAAARDHLQALAAAILPHPATRVLRGDPATALLRAARGPRADLVALGPGRPGLVRRAFLGSVTRRVLRDAACDVLVWRPAHPGGPDAPR